MTGSGTELLLSVGHGSLDSDALAALLAEVGVESLVDIRRYPGSRRNPDVGIDALRSWVPSAGISYRWEPGLGGRRRLASGPVIDTWWRVEQFAAYAAYTRTAEFASALAGLLAEAGRRRTAMMCSEAVWWRCHRRLVADVAVLGFSVPVSHLMHDGRLVAHPLSAGARVGGDGQLVWDG